MGLRKYVHFSVRCDMCKTGLEEYLGNNLDLYPKTTEQAIEKALEKGYIKTITNKYLCPKCVTKAMSKKNS